MRSFNPRRLVIPAALFLAFSSLYADEKPYTGSEWALIDSGKALEAAKGITLAKYPDSDDATVEEKMVQTYKADGTGENQDEVYLKVLTEKGKQDRRTLQLGFLLPYFTVEVAKLEVIKPDGTVDPVNVAANSAENIDSSQMEENIFDPNSKVLQVNIPDLEIGDVVHWVTHFNIKRPIMPGEFSDLNEFEGPGYVRHLVYEVHSPKDKPLVKMVLKDEIPGTVKYTESKDADGGVVHHWDVSNVPRMFDEPSMPPYENVLQRLLVSTTPTWQDVSKWYWNLSQPHLDATSPELQKTVKELTANSKTDLDKAKALFYYVSQKIRYMGVTPEKDRPGFEPHDVSMTFEKQYGVCRDKAALLVSMLRTAGLKAYPVLVNVGSKKDIENPDPGFNHAICALELVKGQYILMDPTDQHARDLQPWYDGDQSYLVARPEGETLRTSSFKPPEDNLVRIRTTGTLSAGGSLQAASDIYFEGANDDVYRNAFADMKPDDRRRYFEEMLKKAIPGAKVETLVLTPENMLDVSKPIKAHLEYTADGMTATGHDTSVVSVPWIGSHVGLVHRMLDEAGLEKRKYPMQTRVACGLDEQVSLKLGKGFGALDSAPDNAPVQDACVSFHQTFGEKDGTLDCSRQLRLKTVQVSPAQYAQLKHTLKTMGYEDRKSPVLAVSSDSIAAAAAAADNSKIPPVSTNATILYSHKQMSVTDAHDAVFRVKFSKRILTYAGKIEDAEIKLNYNPACEDAKVIKGEVISPTGQKQEISNVELNVMDAKWNSTAKRYTGGKVLVASLPGVDVGSTINVDFEITMKNKPYIAGFEPFQLPDALTEKSFELTAPAGLQIEKRITGAGSVKATSAGGGGQGTQTSTWTAENMTALPMEADVPPDWSFMTGVSYFVGDYKAYLKTLNDTMIDRANSRTKAAQVAKQITAKSQDKLEAVKAIRDFVAKTIRPAGPSFTELPLKELSSADTTLEDGYGHGADRAILL
ncbi:MAG TPA: DUF3857 domain-containing protein, partial [Chthoniobacteraceae bacterium]|nr:DUF3857 domain-containing protein [Chthoniobacteraceae bacterium]